MTEHVDRRTPEEKAAALERIRRHSAPGSGYLEEMDKRMGYVDDTPPPLAHGRRRHDPIQDGPDGTCPTHGSTPFRWRVRKNASLAQLGVGCILCLNESKNARRRRTRSGTVALAQRLASIERRLAALEKRLSGPAPIPVRDGIEEKS